MGAAPWSGCPRCPRGLAGALQPRTCRSFCRCRPGGAELPLRRPSSSCSPCDLSRPLRGLPERALPSHLQRSWPGHKGLERSPTHTSLHTHPARTRPAHGARLEHKEKLPSQSELRCSCWSRSQICQLRHSNNNFSSLSPRS